MSQYIVTKKVVAEYELEVEAASVDEARAKVMHNEVEGGDLVDDYYLSPDTWDVRGVK